MRHRWILGVVAATVVVANGCSGGNGAKTQSTTAPSMPGGMSPGATGSMGNANAPFDAAFIDSMIPHHEGAVTMAKQALQESKRPEILTLSRNIVSSQEAEVGQLRGWRNQWYPGLAPSSGMNMPMGMMELSKDATVTFDQRFIDAMIPHHQGAIAMAEAALTKSQHPELRALAQKIIDAQKSEIAQMQQWKQAWFAR